MLDNFVRRTRQDIFIIVARKATGLHSATVVITRMIELTQMRGRIRRVQNRWQSSSQRQQFVSIFVETNVHTLSGWTFGSVTHHWPEIKQKMENYKTMIIF